MYRWKRKSLRNRSTKGKLIDKIIKLMTETRRAETGGRCQACRKESPNTALHHILERSQAPSLVLYSRNMILLCFTCHHALHHYTATHPMYKKVEAAIVKLYGKNYEQELRVALKMQPKITEHYLSTYLRAVKMMNSVSEKIVERSENVNR